MIRGIQDILLKRRSAKLKRKVRVQNLASAKSALILYPYQEGKNEKEVRDFARFLKEEGIKTSSIAYISHKIKEESSRPIEELDYFYFDKQETNWLGIPNTSRLKKLIAKEFDLLIDLNMEEQFPLEWMSSLSKASFKVGSDKGYHKKSCDLMLGTTEGGIRDLQEQCKHYLNMINKKN